MASHLYLVRHGKTLANSCNKFAGRTDESLSAPGRQQVTGLVSELSRLGIEAIYAGPLVRTMQTADIVAGGKVSVFSEEGLVDIDLPHWDGLTKDEIRARFGAEYPTWLATPELFHVDGCEDLHQVQQRAVAAVDAIVQKHEFGTVLLVTHLIVARCLILHATGQPMSQFREIAVNNGQVVELQVSTFGVE